MSCPSCDKYAVKCGVCGAPRPENDVSDLLARQQVLMSRLRRIKEDFYLAQQRYYEAEKPIMDELMRIVNCLPPKPIELEEGQVVRYVGPLAAYKPGEHR